MAGNDTNQGGLKMAALGVYVKGGDKPDELEYLQFNPSTLSVSSGKKFKTEDNIKKPIQQYQGEEKSTMSVQFFFDTSVGNSDVREKTRTVTRFLKNYEKKDAPPPCVFVYGALSFTGVLSSASVKYLMFSREGVPVRATIDAQFIEYVEMAGKSPKPKLGDAKKTVSKPDGEELPQFAAREMDDCVKWRYICGVNNIPNPRLVPDNVSLSISR